ncbi:MAG: hypothetical protein IJV74_03075, partial [Clostridia bacterium]|nr:hypothetical protein [Clostridia bacterium]
MAIVRMQRLHLLAAKAQKEELMTALMRLGCAEIKEQSAVLSDPRTEKIVTRAQSGVAALRAEKALFGDAVKLLDKYAPDPPPLLSAKPVIKEEDFLDEARLEESRSIAEKINELDELIRNCWLEEGSCSTLIEVLSPWKDFSVPLEYSGTAHVGMKLGTIPTVSDFEGLKAELGEKVEECELTEISEDEHTRFLCVFYHRSREEELNEVLHSYGFSVPPFGNVQGTAAENLTSLREKLRGIKLQRALHETHLVSFAEDRQRLKEAYDLVTTREGRAEAMENLLEAGSVVCLDAWITEPDKEKLIMLLEKFDCAYSFEDPSEEEYPEVPVKLRNNRFTNGLNMVTNMYSMPQ